jgi:DNA-binding transcriptional MerR regulator
MQVEVRFKSTAMPNVLTISDVHAQTGVAPSALRYYERRGLVRPVGRAGGKRTYAPGVIEQLALIDLLKQAGFTLTEITKMVDSRGGVGRKWRGLAESKLAQLDAQLSFVRRAKTFVEHSLRCPHPTPSECPVFRRHVQAHARALRPAEER